MNDELPKGLGCVFLFVFLPIIIISITIKGIIYLILFWLKSGNIMDRKRKITNIIGIIVLGTIVIGATIQRGMQYVQEQNDREVTRKMADDLAESLINNSSGDIVMEWAKGEYVDTWGNQFIIDYNTLDKGACVRSRGLDGQHHTEDDIVSYRMYESDEYKIKSLDGNEIQERLKGIKERLEANKKQWDFNFEWKVKKDETR